MIEGRFSIHFMFCILSLRKRFFNINMLKLEIKVLSIPITFASYSR